MIVSTKKLKTPTNQTKMNPSFLTQFCIIIILFVTFSVLQNVCSEPSTNGADMIKSACALTRDRDLCVLLLKSDPRSVTGNIRTFGVIILEKTLSEARSFPIKDKCPRSYRRLVPDILKGIKKLKSDVETVAFAVDNMSDAIEDIVSCSPYAGADNLLLRLLRLAMDILLVLP